MLNPFVSLLGLVVRDEMLDVDVCKAAAVIEDVACLTYVSLVVRQNKYNPDKVAIHCVKSSKNESCLSQLCKQGYTITPTRPFLEFGLVDGEEIEISFNEFCLEGFERKPFSMTFYSALDTAKYRGRLCVVHPDRHFNSDRYCSQMTYRVVSPKISLQRTGTLTLYLPKVLLQCHNLYSRHRIINHISNQSSLLKQSFCTKVRVNIYQKCFIAFPCLLIPK